MTVTTTDSVDAIEGKTALTGFAAGTAETASSNALDVAVVVGTVIDATADVLRGEDEQVGETADERTVSTSDFVDVIDGKTSLTGFAAGKAGTVSPIALDVGVGTMSDAVVGIGTILEVALDVGTVFDDGEWLTTILDDPAILDNTEPFSDVKKTVFEDSDDRPLRQVADASLFSIVSTETSLKISPKLIFTCSIRQGVECSGRRTLAGGAAGTRSHNLELLGVIQIFCKMDQSTEFCIF